ncbi:preprotein translocase subunit SecE [Cellulomonas palmilytica]|uniref:preprotein translocase subunit SecE n=1 Tax=Cellulomonas palmilytica TaxID=2608402 RepID=UPI001F2FC6B5|nr:preprotein translocase subunit SecE [Cellulomonas palmilytica]UJP39848.1 preprotein translocase subunit SecE [Cellulomonas palmilytica]
MSETAASAASGAEGSARKTAPKAPSGERRGLFARIALFVRQVVAELKKVVRPTRQDLITYTSVVLVFVAVVMAFVTLVDLGIGKVTFWVFGG